MSSSVGLRHALDVVTAASGAALPVTCGFRPTRVVVRNATNNVMLEWVSTLADAYAFKTVAAGTRSLLTSGAITPTSTGFSIGAGLTDINDTTTEQLHWEAWGQ